MNLFGKIRGWKRVDFKIGFYVNFTSKLKITKQKIVT